MDCRGWDREHLGRDSFAHRYGSESSFRSRLFTALLHRRRTKMARRSPVFPTLRYSIPLVEQHYTDLHVSCMTRKRHKKYAERKKASSQGGFCGGRWHKAKRDAEHYTSFIKALWLHIALYLTPDVLLGWRRSVPGALARLQWMAPAIAGTLNFDADKMYTVDTEADLCGLSAL